MIGSLLCSACNSASGAQKPNCVADYLTGADRQFESQDQGEELRRALNDMLSLKPSLLLEKRYCDYQMNKRRWNSIEILHRYFVPTSAARALDAGCFQKSIESPASKLAIKKQLDDLSKDLKLMSSKKTTKKPSSVIAPTVQRRPVPTKSDSMSHEKLFDNASMYRVLKKSLMLSQSDMVSAKKLWTEVIDFMHTPGWFPTAAFVPVCISFAQLADKCIEAGQIDDAHQLMHAAFEFPFYEQSEEETIDAVATKLVEHDKKSGNLKPMRSFLVFASAKITEKSRLSKYKTWLNSINTN